MGPLCAAASAAGSTAEGSGPALVSASPTAAAEGGMPPLIRMTVGSFRCPEN